MTNCEFCTHIHETFREKKINEEDPERERCKVSGLIIKKYEIKNRCAKCELSELGKIEMLKQDDRKKDAEETEKYWHDKYTLGKEVPPNYRKKFESMNDQNANPK